MYIDNAFLGCCTSHAIAVVVSKLVESGLLNVEIKGI